MTYQPRFARQFDGGLRSPSPFSYGAGEPPAGWTPFAASSPWNRPIPASPALSADSAAVVAYLNSVGKPTDKWVGVGGTAEDFDTPVYYAAAGDPLVRVKIQAGSRDPSVSQTTEANIAAGKRRVSPIHNALMPLPAVAQPAKGTDEHLAIVTATHVYELWKAGFWAPGEGRYGCRAGAVTDLAGDGRSLSGHGATASGASVLAGPIRLAEIEAGHIPHALAMTVKYVRAGVFEPTTSTGAALKDPAVTAGDANDLKRPLTGCRFQLAYTEAEINALAIPAVGKVILQAMREYGMIPIDTGGTSWSIKFESGAVDVARGKSERWQTFWAAQGMAPTSGGPAGSRVLPLSNWADWTRLQVVAPF